jgi:hypothetical protein
MEKWGEVEVLTPLPAAGIPELLKPTADLFCGSSLSGDVEYVVRYEAIAVWEPAQRAGRTGGLWTVLIEGWEKGRVYKWEGKVGEGGRTFY